MSGPGDPGYRYSIQDYPDVDGEQTIWEFSFYGGYILPEHVKVVYDDTEGNRVEVLGFEWVGPYTIKIDPPVPEGSRLRIYRETPKTLPLNDFADGAVLKELNLDTNFKQAIFCAAEALDRGEGAIDDLHLDTAVRVPAGEIGPVLPIRDQLKGKVIAVDAFGNFFGMTPGDIGSIAFPIDASNIEYNGLPLIDNIEGTLELLGANTAALNDLVTTTIELGTTDTTLNGLITDLRADHEALSDALDVLDTFTNDTFDTVNAAIISEGDARVDGDTALAATIALIGAESDGGTAFILDLDTVKTGPTETLANRFSQISSDISGVSSQVTSEEAARIAADSAEASTRAALGVSLSSGISDVAAAVVTEASARASADTAEASARTALASTVDSNQTTLSAAITSEATTRASADTAFANTFNLLGAVNGGSTAFVLNTSTVQITGGSTLSSVISGLSSADSDNSAAIISEASTRASADSAMASDITGLTSTVGGHTSTLTTYGSSISGLQTKYGVSLNGNGHITGFVMNNNSVSGNAVFVVDNFYIIDPGGTIYNSPFEVSGGIVRIKAAVIGNATITDAHIANLTVDKLTSGDVDAVMNFGSGRTVFNNGAFMKVVGVGFGTSSQFIEWFGPTMSITSCSEANAISYLKTNGDAYFGGALLAGTIRNATQTTNTSSSASVTLGPNGSLGHTRSVIVSYNFNRFFQSNWPPTTTVGGTSSATIEIERDTGSGFTHFDTLNVTGGYDQSDDGSYNNISETMSGSKTMSDTAGGTTVSYRAYLTSRNMHTYSGTPINDTWTQNISIIQTET